MDSNRGDDDIGLDAYPVVETELGAVGVLAETKSQRPIRVHHPRRQRRGEDCDQIRPVNAELCDACGYVSGDTTLLSGP